MDVGRGFRAMRVTDDYETRWIYVGALGAVDFHCTNRSTLERMRATTGMADLWRSGGIETHYRTPPDYMRDDQPSHEHCWILGGKCWHDGSSLAATERWIPLLESCGEEAIWSALRVRYADVFGESGPSADAVDLVVTNQHEPTTREDKQPSHPSREQEQEHEQGLSQQLSDLLYRQCARSGHPHAGACSVHFGPFLITGMRGDIEAGISSSLRSAGGQETKD